MNSYNLLKNSHGYYGNELNDGIPNEKDDNFYNLQDITETFMRYFPYRNAYSILVDNKDIIINDIDGIQIDLIHETFNKTLGIDIYAIVPNDFENKKRYLLSLYEKLLDTLNTTNVLELDEENKLKVYKRLLLIFGFNVITMDDDIVKKIIANVEGWYYGE